MAKNAEYDWVQTQIKQYYVDEHPVQAVLDIAIKRKDNDAKRAIIASLAKHLTSGITIVEGKDKTRAIMMKFEPCPFSSAPRFWICRDGYKDNIKHAYVKAAVDATNAKHGKESVVFLLSQPLAFIDLKT